MKEKQEHINKVVFRTSETKTPLVFGQSVLSKFKPFFPPPANYISFFFKMEVIDPSLNWIEQTV